MKVADTIVDQYLEIMARQRETCFARLAGVDREMIWARPTQKAWSIGENLDHLRVIAKSTLGMFKMAWVLNQPWARLVRSRAYDTAIDNVYRCPGFPQNVGWIWPPKYTPARPTDLENLSQNLAGIHVEMAAFYKSRPVDLLGHVSLWDPAIGLHNLIKWLRVGIYHEEMHYEQIEATLSELRRTVLRPGPDRL